MQLTFFLMYENQVHKESMTFYFKTWVPDPRYFIMYFKIWEKNTQSDIHLVPGTFDNDRGQIGALLYHKSTFIYNASIHLYTMYYTQRCMYIQYRCLYCGSEYVHTLCK